MSSAVPSRCMIERDGRSAGPRTRWRWLCDGGQARAGADPGHGRGSGQGVLHGPGGVRARGGHRGRRAHAGGAADAARFGLLDRDRRRHHRRGTRLVPRHPPGRDRHRGRPGRAGGARRRGERGPAPRAGRMAAGAAPGPRRLRVVRRLRRPGRQHLGPVGTRLPPGGRLMEAAAAEAAEDLVARATAGDEGAFAALTERHRRELHVHCYRMLASFDDAEDAVQEAFLRAWRARSSFDGENARAWLYRIATNVCLDRSRVRQRRVRAGTEVSWLTPYPDTVLDQVPAEADEPDQAYVARETIELAFLAALQVLPPRQRATLLAREVLGLPAADTA